jgi:hypothetical protein
MHFLTSLHPNERLQSELVRVCPPLHCQKQKDTANKKHMNTKSIALVLFLSITLSSFAKTIVSVTPAAASVYNVNYKSLETGRVKISIFNERNTMVFSEVLNNVASFNRPYNFSELQAGVYTIVLEGKDGKQIQTITHTVNKPSTFISVKEVASAVKKYQVNVISSTTETVSVRIYNATSDLIHEETMTVNGFSGFIFDLNQIKSNNITFEVSTASGKTERASF